MNPLVFFISGATFFAFLCASLLFYRFWIKTRDRLFRTFSLSFFLLAMERIFMLYYKITDDFHSMIYLMRLFAFLGIIVAVAEKNRAPKRKAAPQTKARIDQVSV